MLRAISNFYNSWKIARILDAVVRVSVVLTGAVIALQALEVLLAPQVVYAEESSQQIQLEKVNAGHRHKYEIRVRESLDLQKDFGNPASSFRILDYLLGKIEKKVKPRSKYNKREAIKALKAISCVLKQEGKFEYRRNRRNRLLIEGLKRQKNGKRFIDCDDYSSIYLVAGERLGLPLELVYAPKHVFLMCRLNDSTHFYWEPTIATEKDVGFYRDWLNIPEESDYPKILSEKEFKALQFCNLGVAWYEKRDYEKSIEYSKQAIRLTPIYATAFNNLGVAYAKQGHSEKAIECYEKATSINPNYAEAFSNTGVAFYRLGYFEKAVEYFDKAIEADPKYDRAHGYKAAVLAKERERNQ